MPIWGWVCVGLAGAAAVTLTVMTWLQGRKEERLRRYGTTVLARVILANSSLYEVKPTAAFEFAFVVFTPDPVATDEHLAYLGEVAARLSAYTPGRHAYADGRKIAWAMETQRTVGGGPLRIPAEVSGGRDAFFTTISVPRRLLPEGRLTRDYVYLQVIIDGDHHEVQVIEYPVELKPAS